jgi:hypothetical protein
MVDDEADIDGVETVFAQNEYKSFNSNRLKFVNYGWMMIDIDDDYKLLLLWWSGGIKMGRVAMLLSRSYRRRQPHHRLTWNK